MNGTLAAAIEFQPQSEFTFDFSQPHVWLWLRARWGKEQDAADWFRMAHLPAYWPNRASQVASCVRGKIGWRRPRLMPVIPGYLFLACAPMHNPLPLLDQVPGVTGIMRNPDGQFAVLSDGDIATIRRIEAKENTPPPGGEHNFKIGDKVRFTSDIHANWPPGRVGKLYKDGRISVDTPVLGRVVPFVVYPHQIEAMQAKASEAKFRASLPLAKSLIGSRAVAT